MYERKSQRLAPRSVYYRRVLNNFLFGSLILFISLLIGIVGYHYAASAGWVDSLHNASMILSGMGPVLDIKSTGGKLFSSFYALFCGIVFISTMGIILAPVIHRFFHKFHLEDN